MGLLQDMLVDPNKPQSQELGQKNDPAGVPVGPYGHGEGGLFNVRETNDAVFGAMILPQGGALDTIPVYRRDPLAEGTSMFGAEMASFDSLMTGITKGDLDDFANQPTTDCADGPVGGLMKLCTIANPFGRYRAGIREVSMYRAGQRADRLDPISLRLMNSPTMQSVLGISSNTPSAASTLTNEIARRMYESAVSFRRMFAPRVWIGSPANNNGEARDIVGLQTHINAGNKIDFQSSAVCTAANSDIKDFDYDLVGGNGRNLVEYLEMAEYYAVEWNGGRMGLNPISGWLFMRPEIWREISSTWPIEKYYQSMAQIDKVTNGRVLIDAAAALRERDTFRTSHQLPINGRMYMVVEDDSIPVQTSNETPKLQPGQYASDIYFVPATVLGGIPVTFFEHYDHNNEQAMTIQQLAGGALTFTTDNGLFRWYMNFKNGCLNMTYEFSPRLKVKTPQVAFRILNVAVEPLQAVRSWDPDSSYFADGGNTSTAGRKYYTTWSPTTPVSLQS